MIVGSGYCCGGGSVALSISNGDGDDDLGSFGVLTGIRERAFGSL